MKCYAEDIDTLLVFAGLFTAFLSAFVAQTSQMLTVPDSATVTQLLALSASAQLRALGATIPPTLNSTLTSLQESSPFRPSTAARAINISLFLSLILSIASAFLGILSKQWIREYLKWNSALALPRENVLVRQGRVEAWEAWNVAVTISSIPALLELAMVLFLVGVVVLLWTLDDVVAIVVTIFASIFLAGASALTVLPVVSRRCPYKSPTAWACVAAWHFLKTRFASMLRAAQRRAPVLTRRREGTTLLNLPPSRTTSFAPSPVTPHAKSQREWDLSSCREIRGWKDGKPIKHEDALRATYQELTRLVPPSRNRVLEAVLVDIAESAVLIRALTWVKQSSQDPRVHAYSKECAMSIHPEFSDDSASCNPRSAIDLVANRYLLLALQHDSLENPHSALFYTSSIDPLPRPSDRLRHLPASRQTALEVARFLQRLSPLSRNSGGAGPVHEVVGQMLVGDLQRWVAHGNAFYQGELEICAIVQHLVQHGWPLEAWYVDALRIMVSVECQPGEFGSLRDSILLKVVRQKKLALNKHGKLVYSDRTTTLEDHEVLLLQYFCLDAGDVGEDHTTMFFITAMRWLDRTDAFRDASRTAPVLLRLCVALEAFARQVPEADEDPLSLCWYVSKIVNLLSRHISTSQLAALCPAEFRKLVHAVEKCYIWRLGPSSTNPAAPKIHLLLQAAHDDNTPCEVSQCPILQGYNTESGLVALSE
ncbi:hypothetical protein PsYK624_011140 [Phanerochaete sordida]|uniref:DUF6535 domain-containing protein n=1 Tax=Phanerochaete sordida TaxID=48140 RepID=A0A9P3FYU9_9APHY|nr:hypothetical protein PsYK624_011140 [Phanerochaete sordida]